jgi:formamidopyrimidine-DNA glycosylase
MPELPEVQTIVDDLLTAQIVGHTIQQVLVYWPRTVGYPSLALFKQDLLHKKILGINRRGKYLIFRLSGPSDLVVHLRMTGRLLFDKESALHHPYIRLALQLDHNNYLLYHDTRKFGRWYLVDGAEQIVGKLGPEPLETSLKKFNEIISAKKRALKPLLLDQTFLAGLGNIYVDEALWEAKLHPLQKADTLNENDVQRLHQGIIFVLKRGLKHRGTTLGTGKTNYYRLAGERGDHQSVLSVFRRTGQACPRCQHIIERLVVAQRSTHICPHCQKFS